MKYFLIFLAEFSAFMLIRNEVVFRNHMIIGNAIHAYTMDCIRSGRFDSIRNVDYEDIEDYSKTMIRFWDFGYTRLLPTDKFKIIKPYIGE